MENLSREQILQSLLTKITGVFRGMIDYAGFPFEKHQLSRSQIKMLFCISKADDGITVKDLANSLQVTSAAITQFTDCLVKKDVIRREEDKNDRRVLRLKLTDSAKSHFADFKHNYYQAVSPMFKNLTNQELQQLETLLDKLLLEKKVAT